MHGEIKKAIASIHHERDGHGEDKVGRIHTPLFNAREMTEPLDLSHLRIEGVDPTHISFEDEIDSGTADEEDQEMDEEEEERFTRGRSRSRSVHENDDAGTFGGGFDSGTGNVAAPPVYIVPVHEEDPNKSKHQQENSGTTTNERTGPLAHREVVALQKGLEEATQSMSKVHSREDEEERMAADAEKRKRMLAANHQASSNNEPFKRFKLLLLGDSAVGKSSLILRWTLDTFSANLTSTVGVNFKSKKVQCFGEWIQVQVWDTSGQENFRKITTSYYRGAQGIMLVYDVCEQKSLDNVAYWIKNIKAHASDSVHIVLVGNKIDLRAQLIAEGTGQHCVTTEAGRAVAAKFHVPFFETSAKDASHVDESFMTLTSQIAQSSSPMKTPINGPGQSAPNSPLPSSAQNNNSPVPASTNSGGSNSNGISPNGAGSAVSSLASKAPKLFSSLGRRKSHGSMTSPEGNVAGNVNPETDSNGGGVASSPGNAGGEDKEKCIIS